MGARRTAIRSLPFQHHAKPQLGFEMFKLSSLFERGRRDALGHALETPQRPEFHTLYIGIHGRGQLVVDFTPAPIAPDLVTVVSRGRIQHFTPKAGFDAWMLLFTPEFVELPGAGDPLATPAILWPLGAAPVVELAAAERAAVHATLAQLEAEQARPLDRFQPLILSALLRSVLLRAERSGARALPAGALQKFFTILERDHSRTRAVAHYARASGLSPRRLSELLHARLGRSAKRVIDERVVLEQKRLLANTQITVKELAERTGFEEPTNLVKFFRHHTGQTPLAFRRNSPSGRWS
jgi:AraC family transcriptional activator of pobA